MMLQRSLDSGATYDYTEPTWRDQLQHIPNAISKLPTGCWIRALSAGAPLLATHALRLICC
eukprot:8055121-Karenia_brevis.AAC.1